jgi:hypothetical protein
MVVAALARFALLKNAANRYTSSFRAAKFHIGFSEQQPQRLRKTTWALFPAETEHGIAAVLAV